MVGGVGGWVGGGRVGGVVRVVGCSRAGGGWVRVHARLHENEPHRQAVRHHHKRVGLLEPRSLVHLPTTGHALACYPVPRTWRTPPYASGDAQKWFPPEFQAAVPRMGWIGVPSGVDWLGDRKFAHTDTVKLTRPA